MRGDEEGIGLVIVVVVGDVLDDILHVEVHTYHPHQLQPLGVCHWRVETRLADAEGQTWGRQQTPVNLPMVTIHRLCVCVCVCARMREKERDRQTESERETASVYLYI